MHLGQLGQKVVKAETLRFAQSDKRSANDVKIARLLRQRLFTSVRMTRKK